MKPTTEDIIYLKQCLNEAWQSNAKWDIPRLNRIIHEWNDNKEDAEKWRGYHKFIGDRTEYESTFDAIKNIEIVERLKKRIEQDKKDIEFCSNTQQDGLKVKIENKLDILQKILEGEPKVWNIQDKHGNKRYHTHDKEGEK